MKFAWAVSRMLHLVVDHIEDLEAAVEALRIPELPATAVPVADPASAGGPPARWRPCRRARVGSSTPNVATGRWSSRLVAAGVDAYGVDPDRAW